VGKDLFGTLASLPQAFPSPSSSEPRSTTPPPTVPSSEKGRDRLEYLGYLQANGEKRFFLTLNGTVFVARRGRSFGEEKQVIIVRADDRAVYVRWQDGRGTEEVPLAEPSPLPPPPPASSADSSGPQPAGFGTFWETIPQREIPVSEPEEEMLQIQPEEAEAVPGTFAPPEGDWITEEKR